MTICFALPSGKNRTCWVTRRQWVSLIFRISDLANLPTQIEAPSKDIGEDVSSSALSLSVGPQNKKTSEDASKGVDRNEQKGSKSLDSDQSMIVKKIAVIKTQSGLRVSFVTSNIQDDQSKRLSEKINLNITLQERKTLIETLCSKARQAGWDLDAALKRLRTNQRKQKVRPKSAMH